MVYRGPSRGCEACRRRRVKCDERLPQCGNCVKRKRECPGYRDAFAARLRDETQLVARRRAADKAPPIDDEPVSSSSSSDSSPDGPTWSDVLASTKMLTPARLARISDAYSLCRNPSSNQEMESLCFFMASYVNIPRDASTNIWVDHLLPLFQSAPPESAMVHAFNAVSRNIFQMWTSLTIDSLPAREAYGKAIAALNASLRDPVESKSDHVLGAVYMLDFYDTLVQRYKGSGDLGTHQQGAVAILQHRGSENFKTPQSRRLFVSMRSRHINYSLSRASLPLLDHHDCADLLFEDMESLPSARLDLINGDFAELRAFTKVGPKGALMTPAAYWTEVLSRASEIEERLQTWSDSLPPSWQALPVPVDTLHPSIRDAGVYAELCDVYSSLSVSHVRNSSRSSHISILRLMRQCLHELEACSDSDTGGGGGGRPSSPDDQLNLYIERQSKRVVDAFCASVPYHLGNRTALAYPHEHREYPPVPESLRRLACYSDASGAPKSWTMADHVRAASAIGGWLVLTPLTVIMQPPPQPQSRARFEDADGPAAHTPGMSKEQFAWLYRQLKRIQKIYLLPDFGERCGVERGGKRPVLLQGSPCPLPPPPEMTLGLSNLGTSC